MHSIDSLILYESLCGWDAFVIVLKTFLAVGTFKRPDPETMSEKDMEVDVVKAWSDQDRSMIAEGIISGLYYTELSVCYTNNIFEQLHLQCSIFLQIGTSVANPYSTSLHHSTLAPWMGEHTRKGNILPKTEVKKAMKKRTDDPKHPPKPINEDIILNMIESRKVCIVLVLLVCLCTMTRPSPRCSLSFFIILVVVLCFHVT